MAALNIAKQVSSVPQKFRCPTENKDASTVVPSSQDQLFKSLVRPMLKTDFDVLDCSSEASCWSFSAVSIIARLP